MCFYIHEPIDGVGSQRINSSLVVCGFYATFVLYKDPPKYTLRVSHKSYEVSRRVRPEIGLELYVFGADFAVLYCCCIIWANKLVLGTFISTEPSNEPTL
jgi:hypothetical protein